LDFGYSCNKSKWKHEWLKVANGSKAFAVRPMELLLMVLAEIVVTETDLFCCAFEANEEAYGSSISDFFDGCCCSCARSFSFRGAH
jgi:hypothetical protein